MFYVLGSKSPTPDPNKNTTFPSEVSTAPTEVARDICCGSTECHASFASTKSLDHQKRVVLESTNSAMEEYMAKAEMTNCRLAEPSARLFAYGQRLRQPPAGILKANQAAKIEYTKARLIARLPSAKVRREFFSMAQEGLSLAAIKKAQTPPVADLTWRGRLQRILQRASDPSFKPQDIEGFERALEALEGALGGSVT